MARAAKLKVFRTPIGFHDAYVAAPSRKAALAAWGSKADLFARGAAELVEDPALTHEPLAHPGTVIKRLRGTPDEQLAALPPDPPAPRRRKAAAPPRKASRPSRAALAAAEEALAALEQRQQEARRALEAKLAALQRERRALDAQQADARAAARAAVTAERERYDHALERWRR